MAKRRKYDIVLLGATGFTGQLTAEYLVNHGGADLKWALAGRSLDKLKLVRARLADLNHAAASLDLLQVDVDDVASLQKMATNTRVVITTVGQDRKSVVSGKSVSVRVDLGGRRKRKKKIHE